MSSKGVAIVTGSAQGLGEAIAYRLSHDGYAVVISDVSSKEEQIDLVVRNIISKGGRAIGIVADVTKRSQVQLLVDQAVVRLEGPLQVMVANAGIGHANSIFELSEEHVHTILDVNIAGVFNCFVVAGRKMLDQRKGGKIIAASSAAAFKAMSLVSAYSASKWAVRGLTQVNCYAPGIIGTPMWNLLEDKLEEIGTPKKGSLSQMETHAEAISILGRVGVPNDVANAVGFLAGPDSDFITGQSMLVDGGIAFH